MNNQEYKVRPQFLNINNNEPVFFAFSIKISKWSGSCNNINDPYAKLRAPHVVKNLNGKLLKQDIQNGMKRVHSKVD